MCRNIRTLYNFDPPATGDEIRASALQFVRKLSEFNAPSKANEEAFNLAVTQVSEAATDLINSLLTTNIRLRGLVFTVNFLATLGLWVVVLQSQ